DDQRPFVGILQTMNRAYRKIHCIVGLEKKHIFIANCASLSFNYYPMLIALEVVLQTEALSGIYHKPFDFVVLSFLNDGKVSPRSDLGHFNFFCQRLTQMLTFLTAHLTSAARKPQSIEVPPYNNTTYILF